MKEIILKIFFVISFLLGLSSCLENPPSSHFELEFNNAAELLSYMESQGDYINSSNFPSIVPASEVYQNKNNYLLIDIRSEEDFITGHIQNAVNIKSENLITYFNSINTTNYTKIIIISTTGQAASYFGCLLILDGYTNVHVMKYGMAAWNHDFSSPWINAIEHSGIIDLTQELYPKPDYSKLPSISFSGLANTSESKLKERIAIVLAEGFDDDFENNYLTPVSDFETLSHPTLDYFMICMGNTVFYKSFEGASHPVGAVNYDYVFPHSDFKSTVSLQTIPSNKTIYLYSYAGHISASMTAYLRILGYDARSVLFGGNNLMYSAMLATPELVQFTFTVADINNFEYVTGN